jgi:signal transduction histidine kinase
VWVTDSTGQLLASSSGAGALPAGVRAQLPAVLQSATPVVFGPARSDSREADILFLARVTRVAEGSTQPVGAVVLRANPEPYLYPLVSAPPITTSSGRTALVARDGDKLVLIGPGRDAEAPARRAIPWNEAPQSFRDAIEGKTDIVMGEDARGVRVMSAPRRIEPAGWGLIRQFDETDVMVTAQRQFRLELLALFAGLIAIASIVLIMRRALRMERLQRELVRLELDHLKSQLQPHFLFNALNAIAQELRSDPDKAESMIVRLGDLLRMSLEMGKRQEVRLREELGFLDTYLEFERTRSDNRLMVHMDIDPQALDAMVPVLVLQPLVENAIRHGIARVSRAGILGVRAQVRGDSIEMVVEDNGVGLGEGGPLPRVGVGVGNTLARLEQLYGGDCRLELSNREGGGTTATIVFPLNYELEPATGEWQAWPAGRNGRRSAMHRAHGAL